MLSKVDSSIKYYIICKVQNHYVHNISISRLTHITRITLLFAEIHLGIEDRGITDGAPH